MNQQRIGAFLKELRKEKEITQEQFAETINVSTRTVSRWETGVNLPDISLLVDISVFYDVSIMEIINGERENKIMEDKEKEEKIMDLLSDYAINEKELLLKRVRNISIIGLILLLIGLLMEAIFPNSEIPIYEFVKVICLGVSVGALITMVLYTTGTLAKLKNKFHQSKKDLFVLKLTLTICVIITAISLIAAILSTFGII